MFRFTIRDVLWLSTVIGLVIGWRMHYEATSTMEQSPDCKEVLRMRTRDFEQYQERMDEKCQYLEKLNRALVVENEALNKEIAELTKSRK